MMEAQVTYLSDKWDSDVQSNQEGKALGMVWVRDRGNESLF